MNLLLCLLKDIFQYGLVLANFQADIDKLNEDLSACERNKSSENQNERRIKKINNQLEQ